MQIIKGTVIKGKQLGAKIGFPTINIKTPDPINLDHGVYACWVTLKNDKRYQGAMNFGPRKTFNDNAPQLEIHLINFHDDLYDETVKIEVNKYIRQTKKFDSIQALQEQIKLDIEAIKKSLSTQ